MKHFLTLENLLQEIKRSVEEGTTSANGKTIASPIGSELEDGEGQIAITSISVIDPATTEDVGDGDFQETSKSLVTQSETNAPVVNAELATTKDVGVGNIQETSKSMVTHFEINAPENLSQITKDSSFASIVRELERLVSNKHLASENLSLLTNFLVKHPSIHLTDNAVSDRYKGFAYTCLAELLKFLQTHSVLDVWGSSHSKFVELLQDVRSCGFNMDWLDDVERRLVS
ncbi:hypothetical protein E2542_SST04873 [Spatholobus suberectus]|nr:hypothetical protein E2542_SST04873 [Spatholobus suberectus]